MSDEAKMIEQISNDVSNKLFTPSDDFGDFVGIPAHVEAIMDSKLCLDSGGVRVVGILGPSGIGKTTIARALFNRLSTKFHHRAFVTSKRAAVQDKEEDYSKKLCWAKQLLSQILGQKDIEIESLGMVEQRLKRWKVLIVLDDVDEIKLLETLVGQTGWFGFGSRIIVVTQDKALLKSHEIKLIYEVQLPSTDLALQMFCQSAFKQTFPPDDFMNLAFQVVNLAGNLPLGLNVLGLSLRGKDKEEWVEMMPRLRNGLNGEIEKTLRVSYDGLDDKDQEIFLYIACLLNGHTVNHIRNVLGDGANIGLRMLNDKSLIRITLSGETVEMHNLLQMLGREIVRGESINNPGKRRFLVDAEDICDVFSEKTGTEAVLGICFNTSEIKDPLFVDKNSFQGMYNLRFLKIGNDWWRKSGEGRLYLPQGLVYLPRKLRILDWDNCPLKCIPSNFTAKYLVNLSMVNSKLDKMWDGAQTLQSLKTMNIAGSSNLEEIPDLSYAINLEKMNLFQCTSLVTLPSTIQNLKKLIDLRMGECSKLETLPTDVNLESLVHLDLEGCSRLRSFPKISKNILRLRLDGTAIEEEDSSWIENFSRFMNLCWDFCPLTCLPSNFRPESLICLIMKNSKLEKLWEGVQSLGYLLGTDLSGSENLKEFPNLSKATNLNELRLNGCKSLVMVPCSIRSLNNLYKLSMKRCTGLESLPTNLNLKSLFSLSLSGCSQLKSFPQISRNIHKISLNDTAIEEVPSWIKFYSKLTMLEMRGCKRLKNISPNIFQLKGLKRVDFSDCERVRKFGNAKFVCDPDFYHPMVCLNFDNCFSLGQNAQELIIQSDSMYTILPGGEVPTYITDQACGSSLTFLLPESSLFQEFLGFKVCIALEPPTVMEFDSLPEVGVCWNFRGKTGVHRFLLKHVSIRMDHLLGFHIGFPTEEVTELDYDSVKFDFYYRIYGCSHYLDEFTCHPEACPYSVQRIKGCGIQLWDVSPSWDDSDDDEIFETCSTASSEDIDYIKTFSIDDYKSLPCLVEEEYRDNHSTDDEELNISTFFDEEEDSEILPTHYTDF